MQSAGPSNRPMLLTMDTTPQGGYARESTCASELITVAIPMRIHAHLLPRAIESALALTHTVIEVNVLDDASTDQTPIVASSYAGAGVIHIRNEPALGMAGNWNKAFHVGRCSSGAALVMASSSECSPPFVRSSRARRPRRDQRDLARGVLRGGLRRRQPGTSGLRRDPVSRLGATIRARADLPGRHRVRARSEGARVDSSVI